jgi:protein-S-isoprenylcysteine O-methyltransferase Ste14
MRSIAQQCAPHRNPHAQECAVDQPLPDKANVLAPPPLIFACALALGLALQYFVPLPWLPPASAHWIGTLLAAIAIALAIWGAVTLRAARTAIDPYKSTTAIVQTGPYRFTRNPLYLALTLLSVGIAAWRNAFWVLPMLIPALIVLQLGVIHREETYLDRKFADAYRAYRARVRRWL